MAAAVAAAVALLFAGLVSDAKANPITGLNSGGFESMIADMNGWYGCGSADGGTPLSGDPGRNCSARLSAGLDRPVRPCHN